MSERPNDCNKKHLILALAILGITAGLTVTVVLAMTSDANAVNHDQELRLRAVEQAVPRIDENLRNLRDWVGQREGASPPPHISLTAPTPAKPPT